ncbi:MAG: WD40/YVTN/BNR-like repeat-containing protein, partial [Burkholderiales bacterium]
MRAWLLAAAAAAGAAAALAPPEPLGPTQPVRLDGWRIIGPGGGGTTRRPAISPHDPKVVMLGCDMTGAYLTTDGGASWRMFSLGSVPTAFAFDPKSPATLYAGAEGVYKSEDAGRSWRLVLPDPAQNTTERSVGDHGDRIFFTDDPAYPGSGRTVTIHAIAVDEDDPARVYVAANAADSPIPGTPASPTLLIESKDGGRHWSRAASFAAERIFAIHGTSRGPDGAVRAIGESGVHVGRAGGWEHHAAPGGGRFSSGSFGRDPRSGLVLAYATLPLAREASAVRGGVQVS